MKTKAWLILALAILALAVAAAAQHLVKNAKDAGTTPMAPMDAGWTCEQWMKNKPCTLTDVDAGKCLQPEECLAHQGISTPRFTVVDDMDGGRRTIIDNE